MIHILEPFKTEIDVTDDTSTSELPEGYVEGTKARLLEQTQYVKDLKDGVESLSRNPNIEQFILNEIHKTVSAYDDHVVKSIFHGGLTAYASSMHISLRAESGAGKSYGAKESLTFLPPENVEMIGSQSPKVISHTKGIKKVVVNGQEGSETFRIFGYSCLIRASILFLSSFSSRIVTDVSILLTAS